MATPQTEQSAPDYLTPAEAAARLHVTTRTLARMGDRGDVEFMTLPSGHRRYLARSVDRVTA